MITIWFGSREFLTTTVLDEATSPATVLAQYDVAALPFGASVATATWRPVVSYDGKLGLWVDGLAVGTYRILARVGPGSPDERLIVELDAIVVRSR